MEAFAALAAAPGPGNAGALLRALDAVLPRLGERALVEYGVPLPSSGRCRGTCPPPGADTENKLPWENEPAADSEGGSGVRMPVTKGVEQLADDFLHSPRLQPSQGSPGSEELLFSRSRASRALLQPRVELNSELSALGAGALGSQQPQISGKCGTLGYPQARGKSGSVGSDLQFLGLSNCQQDKVCSSLSFSSKTQRSFCTQAEPTMSFQSPSASQGTFILPSFPLSSPRNSPKHLSAPAAPAGKSQEDPRSLSSSWPLKSFQGLPKPGCQKQLLRQKPGDNTGFSSKVEPLICHKAEDATALLFLMSQGKMQNSLRSLRNSAAKKRAKLSSSIADLESPDSGVKLEFSGDCPSQGSSPTGESGISSQESLGSPVATLPPRRRVIEPTSPSSYKWNFQLFWGQTGISGCSGEEIQACKQLVSCPAESVSGFAPRNHLGFTSEDVAVVGRAVCDAVFCPPGVFGSPPAPAPSQSMPCVASEDAQDAREGAEAAPGRSFQQNSPSHSRCHAGNEGEVSTAQPGGIKVTLSKSAQEKLRRKRKEDKEHNHKEQQEGKDVEGKEEFPWERIRLSMSEPEKLTAERDLFTHLKKSMDQELDNAVKVLLHKAGESNTFIREEVDKALKAMVNNVTPARALCSLINGGQSHLHSAVRRCTAQHLGDILERLGPERALAAGRPVAERLLPAVARFAQDSSQQTRYYGRRMLFSMLAHPDLDKILEKFVPAKDLPYIKETVDSLREKGLGEMPLDTPSAKGRRSQTGNVGHLRSSSTCRDAPIIPDRWAENVWDEPVQLTE
ncbi:Protein FAM179B [Lonchura striata]|uniref:Protein FAM179B n=1 Tax=Lonchura striata TaxID=40157 RepID=A0A218UE41_9PASE|nr:Protein FAM179B [Lonchura striata domestica]